ncbi:MAG: hypothetical protein FWF52_02535 [Candidatus Azobacteroides sp.]|nr:hypothetical protein [Candidatus Azobacteroides sp.]
MLDVSKCRMVLLLHGLYFFRPNQTKNAGKLANLLKSCIFVKMKRLLPILLLLIMSLVAVQPTVAFHYCGKQLRSVGILRENSPSDCCGQKNCCSHYTVKLSTDHFQLPEQEIILKNSSPNQAAWFFLTVQPFEEKEWINWRIYQTVFPLGIFAPYQPDLLSWICIFRI